MGDLTKRIEELEAAVSMLSSRVASVWNTARSNDDTPSGWYLVFSAPMLDLLEEAKRAGSLLASAPSAPRCLTCGGSGYVAAGMLAEEPCPSCAPASPSAAPREQGTVPPEVRNLLDRYGSVQFEYGTEDEAGRSEARLAQEYERTQRARAALEVAILAYGASERERAAQVALRQAGYGDVAADGLARHIASEIRSLGERGGGH